MAELYQGKISHRVRVINQIADFADSAKDKRRMQEFTGQCIVVCNCGMSTGWRDRKSIDLDTLLSEHTNDERADNG